MKNRKILLITMATIVIIVVFVYLWMSGAILSLGSTILENSGTNESHELKKTNSSLKEIPPEIKHEIWLSTGSLGIHKWEIDSHNDNQVNLFVHDVRNDSVMIEYEGIKIGNYTIHIIHDTEFETTRSEVSTYFLDLKKDPEYQIATIAMAVNSPDEHTVELWCYNLSPKNKKLDKTTIKGWNVEVRPMSPMPIPQTTKPNASPTPR